MWSRQSIILFCLLLLLVFCPQAFCQTRQAAPIKGVLSVDSTGIRATQVSPWMEPVRIGLSGSEPEMDASGGALAPGYVKPPDSPKCQWVKYHFSDTRWQWFIRKPGCYAAKALTACIQSNGRVRVDFGGFDKLNSTDNSGDRLDTYYGITSPTGSVGGVNWMTCGQFNNYQMLLCGYPYPVLSWALWQKVCVEQCDNAADYKDAGYIGIDLLNNFPWIEGIRTEQSAVDK